MKGELEWRRARQTADLGKEELLKEMAVGGDIGWTEQAKPQTLASSVQVRLFPEQLAKVPWQVPAADAPPANP